MIADEGLDLLLDHAIVITGDPAAPLLRDASVGIRDGLITVVKEGPADHRARRIIDLSGHVVAPGFVNLHTHAMLTMVRGVAEDRGFAPAYTPGVPRATDLRPVEARAFARLGVMEALLFGSTTLVDAYAHADFVAEAARDLGSRAWVGEFVHDVSLDAIAQGDWTHDDALGDRTLEEGIRIAERWNGAGDGRISATISPHAPDTCSPALLERSRAEAAARGLTMTIHLAQSRAELERVRERDGCSPVELLQRTGLLEERLIAAHGIFVDVDADAESLARPGFTLAHVPKGNATGGTIAPTSEFRRRGARVGLATDNMHADMVEVMRWAVAMGRIQDGGVGDHWQPSGVLQMATRGGAEALGAEHRIGAIAPGLQADVIALDFNRAHLTPLVDPVGSLVHVGQGRDVQLVVVAGTVVVQDGRPTLIDAQEVLDAAQDASDSIWARVRPGH